MPSIIDHELLFIPWYDKNPMEKETLPNFEHERSREIKEPTEKEMSPELIAAAMKERAEFLVKEVKTNTQQMQNILAHMAQVKAAIAKIRQQLALQTSDDASSLTHDEMQVAQLRGQIAEHTEELENMRGDLIKIYAEDLKKKHPNLSEEEVQQQSIGFVHSLLSI